MTPFGLLELQQDEGFRPNVYTDTTGNKTIGFGTNLTAGISREEAEALVKIKLAANVAELKTYGWFNGLSAARQDVIENMTYNMGIDGVLGFHDMIADLESGDFYRAANEMLASFWAGQVGARAIRLAQIMRNG